LLEVDAYQDVAGGCEGKNEVRQRHVRRGPEREQETEI
jgi:hypothetical protein